MEKSWNFVFLISVGTLNRSNSKQRINNNRTTTLEQTAAQATWKLEYISVLIITGMDRNAPEWASITGMDIKINLFYATKFIILP